MTCKKVKRLTKALMLLSSAVAISLSANAARANSAEDFASNSKRVIKFSVVMGEKQAGQNLNAASLKRYLNRLAREAKKNPKLAKALAKGCVCATGPVTQDLAGWGSCLKNCLADVGVSPTMLILCGATCAFGGIPLCAICLGVSIAVIEVCALGCAAYPKTPYYTEARSRRLLRPGPLRRALRLQPAPSTA